MNAYELADLNDWACCANSKEVSAMLRQQADRIAELENNTCSACGQKVTEDLIHTCSPQTKPLSDDEIEQIAIRYYVGSRILPIQYARAIEERHGIK